jgi:hypothetical protein
MLVIGRPQPGDTVVLAFRRTAFLLLKSYHAENSIRAVMSGGWRNFWLRKILGRGVGGERLLGRVWVDHFRNGVAPLLKNRAPAETKSGDVHCSGARIVGFPSTQWQISSHPPMIRAPSRIDDDANTRGRSLRVVLPPAVSSVDFRRVCYRRAALERLP